MRILYVMHVDWHWIKQRPHFLAEGLSALPGTELMVAYPRAVRRFNLVKSATAAKRMPVPVLPFSRYPIVQRLNERIRDAYVRWLAHWYRADVLWLTFPDLVSAGTLKCLAGLRIVYDCMDDAPAFATRPTERLSLLAKELALLRRADMVLTSSSNLSDKAVERGACAKKVKLVRNAFNGCVHVPGPPQHTASVFRFLYFGTVAEYIDFDLIVRCLRTVDSVEFHFVGPTTTRCPRRERLIFHEPIEHRRLPNFVQSFDCFLLPFKLTELTRAVDPVKLYEYINFNKNILSIYYPELDRFSEFVTFYRNESEFLACVEKLSGHKHLRYRPEQRLNFLQRNTWTSRVAEVAEHLRNSYSSRTA